VTSNPAAVREDDGMDAPTAVETQIAELSKKIEHLTNLVVAMQENIDDNKNST
jgi:hypothetical protein